MENNENNINTDETKVEETVVSPEKKKIPWKEKTKKQKFDSVCNIIGPILMIVAFVLCFRTGVLYKEMIHYQKEATDYEYVMMLLESQYTDDYDKNVAMNNAINGYLSSIGDKYAYYLSPEQHEKHEMSSNGEKIVLGITFDVKEDKLFISSIEKNSAAETSGLKVGDRLISIKDKKAETYAEYVAFYINNSFTENEDVKVMVERNSEKLEFKIKPKKTTVQLSKSEVIDNILYIELSTFSEKSFTEINETIKSIETKYDGIVLDLRDNGGGSLESLEKIAGLFMKDKLIAEFKYKNETEKCYTKSGNAFTDLPIVVLVNGNSASASECLTGALKCHKRATIVGTQTFGKGIGQSTYQCPNGGYVTFTTSKYYLPNGECIHEVGITPDIVVELPKEVIDGDAELTKDNDTQLQKAIELLKK